MPTIRVEPLTAAAYAPFGYVLGERPAATQNDVTVGVIAAFWAERDFGVGPGGVTQFIWAVYAPSTPQTEHMESHRLTEQAIIPVTGKPILHLVAPPNADPSAADNVPDLSQAKAFLLDGTKGVVMARGTWHCHFGLVPETVYCVLTRRSTTDDILAGRLDNALMKETVLRPIEQVTLVLA